MDGMNDELAQKLATAGICTMEDLAEQSIDELTVVDGIDDAMAGELIMTARAPWFAEEEPSEEDATNTDPAPAKSDA